MLDTLRILHLEDSDSDAELTRFELRRAGIACELRRVAGAREFRAALDDFSPDLVLADYRIPGYGGMEALADTASRRPGIPFIIVSGTLGEERAIEAMRAGATDYVLKDALRKLGPAISRALADAEERAARQLAQEQLRETEQRFRLFADNLPGVMFIKGPDGRYVFLNAGAEELFARLIPGYRRGGPPEAVRLPEGLTEKMLALDRQMLDTGQPTESLDSFEAGGRRRYMRTTKFPIPGRGGEGMLVGGISLDVTAKKEAEDALRLQQRAVEASYNAILIVDAHEPDLPIVYVNAAFERITGYAFAEALGRNCRFLQGTDRDQPELGKIRAGLAEGRDVHATLRNYRKDGELFWVDLYVSPVRDPATGEVTHFVGIQHDVTESRRQEEALRHNANHDLLTGLANRRLLGDRLERSVVWARRYDGRVTVAFLDLDRFKRINDSLGHGAGDHVLQVVAARIKSCLREEDTVARMGGDEFVVVLSGEAREQDHGIRIMRRIVDAVAVPIALGGSEVSVTCSAGLAQYPDDGADSETLLRAADAALFRAKDLGRNNLQFYAAGMNAAAVEHLKLESQLRTAVERNELVLYYQPQVELAGGRIIGAEALLRWIHPELGMVSPAEFIPLAEESGLIVQIGEWVLQTACAANRALQDAGLPAVRIAVNISARQFHGGDLPGTVSRVLASTGLEARFLELELTESVVMRGVADAIPMMDALHATGVELSIDDFGTGYSSLSYLKRFPVDRLKIDQSFVRDITTDRDDALITQAVIALGHGLDLKVIAEGVETAEHREFLLSRGCDEAQGYYFARPMPIADLTKLLAAGPAILR